MLLKGLKSLFDYTAVEIIVFNCFFLSICLLGKTLHSTDPEWIHFSKCSYLHIGRASVDTMPLIRKINNWTVFIVLNVCKLYRTHPHFKASAMGRINSLDVLYHNHSASWIPEEHTLCYLNSNLLSLPFLKSSDSSCLIIIFKPKCIF